MTDQLEQEVRRIIESFVADVWLLARRTIVHEVLAAFAGASDLALGAVAVAKVSPPKLAASRRPSIDTAEERARIVGRIREHPGLSTAGLSKSLGIHPSRLRRVLRAMADERVIRIEASLDSLFGGQRSHRYFAVEPIQVAEADMFDRAAGAAA